MRALVTSLPLHGHTNPLLRLVRALVERGEEVTVVSTPPFESSIRAAGAHYRFYANPFLANLATLPGRTEQLSWLLMKTTAEILTTNLAATRAEKPDYVITDSLAPWGQWIGQILRVPVVTSITTFAFNRHVLALAASRGARPKNAGLLWSKLHHVGKAALLARRLRRTHGVAGMGPIESVMGHSALNLVYTSRLFQPRAETFDDHYQFIGPGLGESDATPAAASEPPDARPLVYVSLGTLFNNRIDFYTQCIEAFADQPVRVLIAIGDHVSAEALGTLPSNVTVRAHVDQLAVLQGAAAFVSHGGMNSVSESLMAGVPLVVVPQMSEQQLVGSQVAALGAGVCLAGAPGTSAALREAVTRVMRSEDCRRHARRIGQSLTDAGGTTRGAACVLAFAAAHAEKRPRV
ncbi:MAG: macrolide family glycosyltransferase [Vicinamibacterales bacterium]